MHAACLHKSCILVVPLLLLLLMTAYVYLFDKDSSKDVALFGWYVFPHVMFLGLLN